MTIVLDETPKDFKPPIESSTFRSYKAYKDAGFEKDIPRITFGTQYERENIFLSGVKGEPERRITKMIRQKVKGEEYLTFTENWTGYDWAGRELEPVTDRIEGIVHLPKIKPEIDEKGQRIGRRLNGSTPKYEIPFSKEAVEKWIEETGTPREDIIFTVKGPNALRGECVVYEQFIYPWNQAVDVLMKDGGFQTDYVEKRNSSQTTKQKP